LATFTLSIHCAQSAARSFAEGALVTTRQAPNRLQNKAKWRSVASARRQTLFDLMRMSVLVIGGSFGAIISKKVNIRGLTPMYVRAISIGSAQSIEIRISSLRSPEHRSLSVESRSVVHRS
jgi:hypothetical protein